jgi:hypothetical protein
MLLQDKVQWRVALFGDGCALVQLVVSRLWLCLQITVLFLLWKLGCKSISSKRLALRLLSALCGKMRFITSFWQKELC